MPTAELCISSRLNRFDANWIALFAASMLPITTACGSSKTATRDVEPGRGGERAEHGHRDVAQRDLRRHDVAEPCERHAEPVAPAHALARVGDEAVRRASSAGSRTRCSSRPRANGRDRTASCPLRRRRRASRGARARARRSGRDSGHLFPQTVFEHTERSGLTPANQPASVSDHNMPFGRDEHSHAQREALAGARLARTVRRVCGRPDAGRIRRVADGRPHEPGRARASRRARCGSSLRPDDATALTSEVEAPAPRGRRRPRDAARRGVVVRARTRSRPRRNGRPASRARRSRATARRPSASTRRTTSRCSGSRLLPDERGRLRELAHDAALALEESLKAFRPGELDRDIQARIADALERRGALAVCLIVGRRRPRRAIPPPALARRADAAARDGRRRGRARRPARGRDQVRLRRTPLPSDPGGARGRTRCRSARCSPRARPGRPTATSCSVVRSRLRGRRPSAGLARALPGRPDRLPPARVRDRADAGGDSRFARERIEVGHALAWNPERARRRQVRGHLPRRARGTRADHRHRRAGRCSRTAGRRCSTSRAERRRRSQREGPTLARAARTAATGDGRRKRVALSRRRGVPHRDPERRGPARARRGHRRPRRASGSS